MAEESPEGFFVRVRRSVTQPMLIGGVPFRVIGAVYIALIAVGVVIESWIPVFLIGFVHLVLASEYARDPQLLEVVREHFALDGGEEEPEKAAGRLPWAFLVGPEEGTVLQKGGAIQRTWRFVPPDMDSTTLEERRHLAAQLNNVMRRLGTGWSIFVEAGRESTEGYPVGEFPDPVTELIDEERRRLFEGGREHFATEYFLTLAYQPPRKEKSRRQLVELFVDDPRGEEKPLQRRLEDALEAFARGAQPVVGMLERQFPEWEALNDQQTLTYLHRCVSEKEHPIKAQIPEMYIDVLVGDCGIDAGLGLKVAERFVETISIRAFPAQSYPGILRALNNLAIPYRWMQRFICLDKADAATELDRYRKGWNTLSRGIHGATSEITGVEGSLQNRGVLDKQEDAEEARRELESGEVSFGFYTGTVTVSGATKEQAEERLELVARVLREQGFATIQETTGALAAWLGSMPGNATENVRRPLLHSLNLAHLLPLSGTWAGEIANEHLGGEAHVQTQTNGTTPFRLNLNVGDVGHTLVLGKTGAGKSTLLALLAAQWRRYDDAQVFFFDKGRSSRALTLGVGGAFYEPAADEGAVCFQPLREVDQKAEREWALEWLEGLLKMQAADITAAIRERLWKALELLGRQRPRKRTFSKLRELVGDSELRRQLRAFTKRGAYGDLLDADDENLSLEQWVTFEMGALMERKDIVGPILEYLFHRLEARFTGAPTLLVLDEAWIYLDNPTFRARIRQWLKTLRKRNVYVVFATQEIVDALESEIASSLLSACPTRILLPHPEAGTEALRPHYVNLGLNSAQIQLLSQAELKRHYYYCSSKGQRLFELGLEYTPAALRFVGASSPEDQKAMDEVLARHGKSGFAAAWLERGGLEGQAGRVRRAIAPEGQPADAAETVINEVFELPRADRETVERRQQRWSADTVVDEQAEHKAQTQFEEVHP
jgi:type IV secretion system protein VirB4